MDAFFAMSDHPFTGFGDDPNWSVKFHVLMEGDSAPDWQSALRMAVLTPATGNGQITQRRGRDPWQIAMRLWLASTADLDRLDAMVGRRATLRYGWGVTKPLNTQPQTIEQSQYQVLPGTMLTDLDKVAIEGDGTLEVTATFSFPYTDPAPFTPPTWPAPPSPVPAYHDIVLATPGLRTYHRLSGGSTEASIGPDTALMTYSGSPSAAASLVTGGDAAKAFNGTSQLGTFSTSSLGGGAVSLEFWFQELSRLSWSTFVGHENHPTSRFGVSRRAAEDNLITGWRDGVGGADYNCVGPYLPLQRNHIVYTVSAAQSRGRLYINGVLVDTKTHQGVLPAGPIPFGVGGNSAGPSANAVIDEVATYAVELDQATVTQHYQAGTA